MAKAQAKDVTQVEASTTEETATQEVVSETLIDVEVFIDALLNPEDKSLDKYVLKSQIVAKLEEIKAFLIHV